VLGRSPQRVAGKTRREHKKKQIDEPDRQSLDWLNEVISGGSFAGCFVFRCWGGGNRYAWNLADPAAGFKESPLGFNVQSPRIYMRRRANGD
jgi:hypothetical protein